MPDIFESFFGDFGKSPSDYYELKKLSPAYRVYFDDGGHIDIPDNLEDIYALFESIEKGSAEKLRIYSFRCEVSLRNRNE